MDWTQAAHIIQTTFTQDLKSNGIYLAKLLRSPGFRVPGKFRVEWCQFHTNVDLPTISILGNPRHSTCVFFKDNISFECVVKLDTILLYFVVHDI